MHRFTPYQEAEFNRLKLRLKSTHDCLHDSIDRFNYEVAELITDLEVNIDRLYTEYVGEAAFEFDNACTEVVDFYEEVLTELEQGWAKTCLRWRESEEGQSYEEWLDQWHQLEALDEGLVEAPTPYVTGESLTFDCAHAVDEWLHIDLSPSSNRGAA